MMIRMAGRTRVVPRLSGSVWRRRLLVLPFVGACLALLTVPTLAAVSNHRLGLLKPSRGISRTPSATAPYWACPDEACEAIVAPRPVKVGDRFALPDSTRLFEGGGELGGLDPAELKSAYKIPTTVESPQTIALIDAFGYPDAESDLATYRSKYGLPPCTTANGCFRKVNGKGKEEAYPAEESGWDEEAALDEDMASAACPECHILLVEATGGEPSQLGSAVNEAVKLGATEVSNSYGFPEKQTDFCGTTGCTQYNKDYEHPGVMIFAGSGDWGYDNVYKADASDPPAANFPASSPSVVAVGGTALYKDAGAARGWREEVWNEKKREVGTGSGCSKFEPKPAWQTDTGCARRTESDIAADAAVETGVSVRVDGGWKIFGGTSVASPLLAGIEAHASFGARSIAGHIFYEQPGSLFDVTEGFNGFSSGECSPFAYVCNGEVGYDGPTGLGTPDGVPTGLPAAPTITKLSTKTGPASGGTTVTITGTNFGGLSAVTFGATVAAEFTYISPTSLTVVSPEEAPGKVDVTVTAAGGTSVPSSKLAFTFKKPKK
jgi:subtilase family serine protease